MRRAGLQATDLLDIVDFIKNEEKYTARINELKEYEARLDEKLQIVNTLEAAEAEEQRFLVMQEHAKIREEQLKQEYVDLKDKLRKEHDLRLEKVIERERDVRALRDQVAEKMETLKAITDKHTAELNEFKKLDQQLTKREQVLSEQETFWRNKITQLNRILGV